VGNNAVNGWINADSLDGPNQGSLTLTNGTPFSEDEPWGLGFGNEGKSGSSEVLDCAAGGSAQAPGPRLPIRNSPTDVSPAPAARAKASESPPPRAQGARPMAVAARYIVW
jgi:hypothetical protein